MNTHEQLETNWMPVHLIYMRLLDDQQMRQQVRWPETRKRWKKGMENQQKGLDMDVCLMHGEEGMDKGFVVKEWSSWKAFIL